MIGHCDLFWTNVIFRDGLPVALIDWELAAPVTRVLDELLAQRRGRLRRGDWHVTKRRVIEENLGWLEEHREGLARFLA